MQSASARGNSLYAGDASSEQGQLRQLHYEPKTSTIFSIYYMCRYLYYKKNRSGLKPIVPNHLPDPLSCLEDIFKKVSYEELKAIGEYHIYDQLFAVVVLLWCKVLLQTSALKQHFNVKYLLLPLAQISSCYREMHQQPEPTSVGVGQVRLCYVILLKHDNAVIFSFSRVYSFDQAQNHWDIRYLKGVKL